MNKEAMKPRAAVALLESGNFYPTKVVADSTGARCGGADRDRTDDLRLAKPALSQLSYSPGGGPGQSRTADLTLIRRALSPAELLARWQSNSFESVSGDHCLGP